ncbi:hypothetical protein PHAVU_009G165700 [Phaseolus vulgaris]|uniref:Uncharacterized protein n=1 Tax=Phaseolus vulgaris TaxID=3885 RepID=V7AWE7_PHAVU|nr:hypothetical protein PHAVU_009G165700g [Phaseolus vulgaris]ESW09899.1 hypothetical protein PHAVU_009G165700g [Phaseolus vulgaris]
MAGHCFGHCGMALWNIPGGNRCPQSCSVSATIAVRSATGGDTVAACVVFRSLGRVPLQCCVVPLQCPPSPFFPFLVSSFVLQSHPLPFFSSFYSILCLVLISISGVLL